MSEIRFEHRNNNNYMVIDSQDGCVESFQMKMLLKNKPEHFLKFSSFKVNSQTLLYYDISSMQPLSRIYDFAKMTIDDVKLVCMNISEAVRIAESYMLDIDSIQLDPQYVFQTHTKTVNFLYNPEMNRSDFGEKLKQLFEFILEHFDHSLDKGSVVKLYEVYQKVLIGEYDAVNLVRMFSDFKCENANRDNEEEEKQDKSKIEYEKSEEIKTIIKEPVTQDVEVLENDRKTGRIIRFFSIALVIFGVIGIFAPNIVFNIDFKFSIVLVVSGIIINSQAKKISGLIWGKQSYIETKEYNIAYVAKPKSSIEDEESHNKKDNYVKEELKQNDIYEELCNETVLLSDYARKKEKQEKLRLVLKNEDEFSDTDIKIKGQEGCQKIISMDTYPYVIGSLQSSSDVIINSSLISRMHCCIYREERAGETFFYLEDLNATNGSFVNSRRLNPNEKAIIKKGDIIRLAMITFEVEMA